MKTLILKGDGCYIDLYGAHFVKEGEVTHSTDKIYSKYGEIVDVGEILYPFKPRPTNRSPRKKDRQYAEVLINMNRKETT